MKVSKCKPSLPINITYNGKADTILCLLFRYIQCISPKGCHPAICQFGKGFSRFQGCRYPAIGLPSSRFRTFHTEPHRNENRNTSANADRTTLHTPIKKQNENHNCLRNLPQNQQSEAPQKPNNAYSIIYETEL